MSDGKNCKCAARSSYECACDADWTPQEVYDLREELATCKDSYGRVCFEILAMQKESDELKRIKASIPNPCYSQDEVNRIVAEKLKIAVAALEACSTDGYWNYRVKESGGVSRDREWVPTTPGIIAKKALEKIIGE